MIRIIKFNIVAAIIVLIIIPINAQQQQQIPWPTLADSPWPMVKHDPQFTGRSPHKGPQTPNIIWTVDMEDGIFSGPVIGEDENLYFGSYYVNADYFYSYSLDGNFLWVYKTGSNRPPQSGIVIDSNNTIYFGSRDSYLYALNPDGTLKWKYETSGFIVQEVIPNIDLQGNIYVTNFIFDPPEPDRGELYSIKPDGTLNWKIMYDNGFAFRSPVFSPDGNTIYIAGVDSNLFALNLDGSIKWKFSCGVIKRAPMIDSNGNIYFTPTQEPQYFYSLKPDGSIRWQYELPLGTFIYSIPTIDQEGNLYSIGLDTTCCPYHWKLFSLRYDGAFRWEYIFDDEESDDFWQPLICDSEGTIYVGSTFGNNYYAISSEGELKWKLPLNGIFQQVDNTGTIAEDGTLYLGVHDVSIRTGQVKTLIAIRDTGATFVDDEVYLNKFVLQQNYPNPFNPSTTINYQLPNSGIVTIKVYDILGREVNTLVNGFKSAGSYEINFSAEGLASGVYIYRLTAANNGKILFTDSKQMILMK
jgi:outer membrane protein assembly factor BamB